LYHAAKASTNVEQPSIQALNAVMSLCEHISKDHLCSCLCPLCLKVANETKDNAHQMAIVSAWLKNAMSKRTTSEMLVA
jgi:Trp operon repressor